MRAAADMMLMLSAAILAIAALWHFYWAAGGTRGLSIAIPQRDGGKPAFTPSRAGTAAVAVMISFLTLLYAIAAFVGADRELSLAVGAAGLIFLLRAIGDFKYVGFFKRRLGTPFAAADSRYFSPLCLFLATSGLFAAYVRFL